MAGAAGVKEAANAATAGFANYIPPHLRDLISKEVGDITVGKVIDLLKTDLYSIRIQPRITAKPNFEKSKYEAGVWSSFVLWNPGVEDYCDN